MAVTPVAGLASSISAGGTPVVVAPAGVSGGILTNPVSITDQGIATAETLYVNQVTAAGLAGNGTTFALDPGQSWTLIPGSTLPVSVNAQTTGHRFSIIYW